MPRTTLAIAVVGCVAALQSAGAQTVVMGKNAKFLVGGEMASLFQNKIEGAGRDPALVLPGTKTATFVEAVDVPVHLPLSGLTMEFDGDANCTAGC